jgi:hypothetical protein
VGVTALAVAWVLKRTGQPNRRARAAWIFIGVLFIYFGIDDASEIHERVGSAIGRFVEARLDTMPVLVRSLYESNPTYNWQAFVAPVYAAAFLFSLTFCWIAFGTSGLRRYIMGCGLLYAVSQFGLDLIEGLDGFEARQENWAAALGIDAYGVTHTFAVTEEVLEMAGTTLLWFAFLRYFGIRADGITLRLKRGVGTAAVPALSATASSPGHVTAREDQGAIAQNA